MSQSSRSSKTRQKSSAYAKHGKHKGLLHAELTRRRILERSVYPMAMYESVMEAFSQARKKA